VWIARKKVEFFLKEGGSKKISEGTRKELFDHGLAGVTAVQWPAPLYQGRRETIAI